MKGATGFLLGLFLGMTGWITHVVYWVIITGLLGWIMLHHH